MHRVAIKLGKVKFSAEKAVTVLILAMPFLNLGNFYGYIDKMYYVYGLLFVLLFFYIAKWVTFAKINNLTILLLVYLSISALCKNFPASIQYYCVVLCGILSMEVIRATSCQSFLVKSIEVIGVFYAISMIWQFINPTTFYIVLGFLFPPGIYNQAIDSVYMGNYTGFACESNRAGLLISPAAFIVFSRLFTKQSFQKRTFDFFKFGVAFFALVLTGRRAFILFFPLVLISMMVYILLKKRSVKSKIILLVLVLALLVLGYYVLYQFIFDLLTGGNGSTIALSNREVYWELAIKMFNSNPLFGTGMRSYDVFYNNMSHRNIVFAGAHNCYLQLLAEIGIVGFVLFFSCILLNLFKTARWLVMAIKAKLPLAFSQLVVSVSMQVIFILIALSESVFIAPYSLILYYLMVSIGLNTHRLYMSNLGTRNKIWYFGR